MKSKIFIFSCLLIAAQAFGQQNYWSKLKDPKVSRENLNPRWTNPNTFSLYQADLEKIKADLKKAPQRFSGNEGLIMKFPDPDGNIRDYVVQEASVMEPELQAKFPEIRSYTGWQKNHPENTIRFSVTPSTGISVMYFDHWDISYLDSYTKDNSAFIVYKRKDLPANDRLFECHIENELDELKNSGSANKAPLVSDGQFRTYRLALSATGEYTTFHGGTIPLAMAAMVTTMTRVNGIYEKTISTTMVMVGNNNQLIYTNASTDPFTNGNPNTMINENQTNTTNIIGSANYDIGHVFGTNSGGLAGLGVVCISSAKARGVTGSGAPIGDPFDIDYVAHEIGHQFGANHTFRAASGSCNGNFNNATAFEPGSGSTIMAYAGICGANNNVQNNSDAYFHAASVLEMYAVLQRANDCSSKISNGNAVPTADAGADYTIPKGTAFVLTGTGTDPNGDPLTYLWEQYDNTNNTQPPVSTATVGPVYRSLTPTASPSRYFPALSSVLANNLVPKWEVTPGVARTLNFSLVVNDNKATGNQAARDVMTVTVTNDGPFTVTSQTSGGSFTGNTSIPVTWNVAGTNTGAINTQNVTILLSKDGGLTFNTVLAASVPNTGSANVTLPNENVAFARIMVKAVNNIYYALNSSSFAIVQVLSTAEADLKSFSIYPNPSYDVVNIKLKDSSQKAEYKLFDASGRLIKTESFKGTTQVNVNNLLNGNYVISVLLENGEKLSEKLIIKK
ncbi:T9SS C-terminal target domain-containing protein [Chryseobacterium shandongense]|uniref:T9SS C-terminal target domain-containing protein n=1 Tax=Chryseobacterium shandongense TaxID=1493872 RepID=A0AAD0YDR3_9FLAO|nr:zinc-dependent metalloprotease family protein [Chryseobacterium shandongense]AZA88192.1 T9SS C-terminal target domain-containing protein [Chryseobacterium shandongense]AZA96753.1 T9SS C-terminal target domain-containing protein [Chryseobacterium shandongense]